MKHSGLSFFSRSRRWVWAAVLLLVAVAIWAMVRGADSPAESGSGQAASGQAAASPASGAKSALTVVAITPQWVEWPEQLVANGNVLAWQEAVISAEISNLRLTDVLVNVGDQVKKGQVLARISSDTVDAALSESRADVAEAEATLADARANAERARELQRTGFISTQNSNQSVTAEKTARARLNAARARMQAEQVRVGQTAIRAPDHGVISARTATVGSLTQPGQELFRLIRGGRLEWRAEVSASDLGKLKPGMKATLVTPDGKQVAGRVRMVAPTVDPQTLNGLVYVDLPATAAADGVRAGIFARGEFDLGRARALSLPQAAVLLRDGFAYVFRIDAENTVTQTKVTTGRRKGEQIELTGGLKPEDRVVASGAGFLADGDRVRVVSAPAASSQP
jgi:RND family efflux transporter MFP subunit